MNTPNRGIPYVPEGTLNPAAGLNLSLNVVDALLQTAVLTMDQTAPPGSNADGDLHIVAAMGGMASGDWTGQENNLARYVEEGDFWQFFVAGSQVFFVFNRENGGLYVFIGSDSPGGWTLIASLDTVETTPVVIQLAGSDLSSNLAAATGVAYCRAAQSFTLTEVRASLIDASSSGVVTVDINVGGSTILSTKLTIDAGELTSTTAATAAVISDPMILDDEAITVDIDGAGTDARGLIVTLIGAAA